MTTTVSLTKTITVPENNEKSITKRIISAQQNLENSSLQVTTTALQGHKKTSNRRQIQSFKPIIKQERYNCEKTGKITEDANGQRHAPEYKNVLHVYRMKTKFADTDKLLYDSQTFVGACIDSGAEKSVIGIAQATAYAKATGRNVTKFQFPLTFRFGDGDNDSKGIFHVRLPLPNDSHIALQVYVVNTDIPLQVGI